jgi:hypothetical protein
MVLRTSFPRDLLISRLEAFRVKPLSQLNSPRDSLALPASNQHISAPGELHSHVLAEHLLSELSRGNSRPFTLFSLHLVEQGGVMSVFHLLR